PRTPPASAGLAQRGRSSDQGNAPSLALRPSRDKLAVMAAARREMVLVGFLQAQNCTNLPASWRHPESRTDFLSPDFYREIARILERGKFHLAFFDDPLAMPDRYRRHHQHSA